LIRRNKKPKIKRRDRFDRSQFIASLFGKIHALWGWEGKKRYHPEKLEKYNVSKIYRMENDELKNLNHELNEINGGEKWPKLAHYAAIASKHIRK
jgi:hypothetical protein